MARAWFGRGSEDFFVAGPLAPGDSYRTPPQAIEVTFWDAETGGTQYTDLLLDGTTPVDSITVPTTGQPPAFQGPDGVVAMWAQAGNSTTRRMMDAGADIATQVAADREAVAADRAAVEAVGTTNDTVIAGRINDRESATAAALSASTDQRVIDSVSPGAASPQAAVDARVAVGAEAAVAAGIDAQTPTPQGLALNMAISSGLPVVLAVQGDSTGNATDEWVYLTAQALATAHPDHRVVHRLWNMTTLAYDTPTIVQAATEAYYTPSSTDVVHLNNTGALASITGDLTIRGKFLATDVDAAVRRMAAAKWGGTAAEQSFWWYIDATNGLTLGWQETGGTFRSAAVASMAQLSAAFSDGVAFYMGVQLDVDNGAGQYTVTGLKSSDGITWTTLGTPVTGSTGPSSVKVSTGYFKPGGRGNTAGQTDPWNGRIYWVEVCSGIGTNAAIKARFEPNLATRVSTWKDAEGNPWVKGASGVPLGSPLLLVLNASSPGMDAGYSVTNFAAQAAIEPTLAILSYSHNGATVVAEPDYAGNVYKPLLDLWASTYPYVPVIVTLQSPQKSPRTADQISDHAARVKGVARLAASRHMPLIDVFTPLSEDLATYVQSDGVHPTAAGELLWAEIVRRALRPAIPA